MGECPQLDRDMWSPRCTAGVILFLLWPHFHLHGIEDHDHKSLIRIEHRREQRSRKNRIPLKLDTWFTEKSSPYGIVRLSLLKNSHLMETLLFVLSSVIFLYGASNTELLFCNRLHFWRLRIPKHPRMKTF